MSAFIQTSFQLQDPSVRGQLGTTSTVAPGTPMQHKCWNCKHDRKGCKRSPDQDKCEWCRQNNYSCTEDQPRDEPPAKRRRILSVQKCQQCRGRKQKCLPEDRVWPEKCNECKKHNDECSEPKAANRTRTKRPTKQIRLSSSVAVNQPDNETEVLSIETQDGGVQNPVMEAIEASFFGNTNRFSGFDLYSEPVPTETTRNNDTTDGLRRFQDDVYNYARPERLTLRLPPPEPPSGGIIPETGISRSNLGNDRMEDLGYLAWLWTKLKPTENLFEIYDQKLDVFDTGWTWSSNFLKLFKIVYRDTLQSAGLMNSPRLSSTYDYLDIRAAELAEHRHPFSNLRLPLESLNEVRNLSRMVNRCQNAGDYLMAQSLQEQLLKTFTRQINSGNAPSNLDSTPIVQKLIQLYEKVSERLDKVARRLELNSNMVCRVAPIIHRAVSTNNMLLISTILEYSSSDIALDEDFVGRNAMHIAMEINASQTLDVLWNSKYGHKLLSSSDFFARRPLYVAAEAGFVDCVRVVQDAIAKSENERRTEYLNKRLGADNCPLQAAAGGGHLETVRLLVANGIGVDTSASGRTALQVAAEGRNVSIITALQAASAMGHIEIVRLLLICRADVNIEASYSSGYTALQAAANNGHVDIVKLLLSEGANVNAKGSEEHGKTALQAAAGSGYLDIVNILLANGADVNAVSPGSWIDGHRETILESAIHCGHVGIIRRLIEHGVKIFREIEIAEATKNWVVVDMLKVYQSSDTYPRLEY